MEQALTTGRSNNALLYGSLLYFQTFLHHRRERGDESISSEEERVDDDTHCV